ncbi:MAG: hypothetical protein JW863_19075 [Chitinispirillaceae bacterium]|nr:hypothetical protein [Chitinispirillaceae bacterium]
MNLRVFSAVALCVFGLTCRNPFFPPTGIPVNLDVELPRSTPQGIINQLIDAYENRQIDLYEDLFPSDGSFKFFVAPLFADAYKNRPGALSEPGDSLLQFVSQSELYYYWTQETEIESSTRLFVQAASIEFIKKPYIESIRKFVTEGDSAAELRVGGGELTIGQYQDVSTVILYTVYITNQIFLLGKDDKGLWVIRKWYDFSTETAIQ